MKKFNVLKNVALAGTGLAALLAAVAPANALVINLIDQGGVTGSASEAGFRAAARYWESVLTNNVTVNLGVGYSALPTNVIGSTGSTRYTVGIGAVEQLLKAGGNSALDQAAILPTITGSWTATGTLASFGTIGTIGMTRNTIAGGTLNGTGQLTSTKAFDSDNTRDNATLSVTAANLKALGYNLNPTTDAVVTFSTAFNFDFDPTNGITAGSQDFIGVAIHEIGHALGFTSGTDIYDQYYGTGPGAASSFNWDNQTIGSVLDLYRYSSAGLDWSAATPSYFSIDGGATAFGGNAFMSTGAYNGDGRQASHFKDTPSAAGGCIGYNQVGIMDPTFCAGEMGVIKSDDLAAMDAIGWNLSFDVLSTPYTINTAQIVSGIVPEPSSWAMMVLGFGVVGAGIRRARKPAAMPAAA